MKRIYRTLGMIVVMIVTALFVWYLVRALRGHDLSVYATPRAAIGIVLTAVCWCLTVPLLAIAWRGLLGGLDVHRSLRELFGIVGISQFGKYVPGHVAQYAGRVSMSLARNIPARTVAVSMILENLLLVIAAIVVGVGTGMLSKIGYGVLRHHSSQLTLIAALVVLAVAVLFGFRRVAPALVARFVPRYTSALAGALLPPRATLAIAFALYCLLYLVFGVGLILLAGFLIPHAPSDYWLLIASFALAWVVGFVTPGSPAGIGVREGLLLLMLAPVYTTASAGVLVIALRIATTLGDLLALVAAIILLPKRRNLPLTTSQTGCKTDAK